MVKAHPTAIRHPKLRSLAESQILLLVTRGLIVIVFGIASFLALRVEQDHDATTAITEKLGSIQAAIQSATANRYTSVDAERDRIAQAAALSALRDDYTDHKTVTRQVLSNHENRIQLLEVRRR